MNDEEISAYMQDVAIPPSARALASSAEEYRAKSLPEFSGLVNFLTKMADQALLQEAGLTSMSQLTAEQQVKFLIYVVIQFNTALPSDYPYVVLMIHFGDSSHLVLTVLKRDKIPQLHERISTAMLIRGFVKTREEYLSGTFDMQYTIYGATLDDDPGIQDPDA